MRETFIFKSSSSEETYEMLVSLTPGQERILCGCPAGGHMTLCKHALSLLKGDPSLLLDKGQADTFLDLHHRMPEPWSDMLDQLGDLEKESAKIRAQIKKHKKMIVRKLQGA